MSTPTTLTRIPKTRPGVCEECGDETALTFDSGYLTCKGCEPDPLTTVTFQSGATRDLHPAIVPSVIGLSAEGRVVVQTEGMPWTFGLTLCCNAYDKGMEGGSGCRACYSYDDAGEYDAVVSDPVAKPEPEAEAEPATDPRADLPRDEDGHVITSATFGEQWLVEVTYQTEHDGSIPSTDGPTPRTVHGPFTSEAEANAWVEDWPDGDTDVEDFLVMVVNSVRPPAPAPDPLYLALDKVELRVSDDFAKTDLELTCTECGEVL
jgi:hypothetical protein